MPPIDNTPPLNMGGFELLHSLQAFGRIPVSEYISKRTGLTVVIAEVEGPVVNGYFCLATEAFDDDGLPHTLEHLIFLGSEEYPYKGVLDLLANRCLASGTNAWTDIDHTCYTMETAGSEGFLALMPIFLEHILYPVLTEEAFITEVYHITEEGKDAGVVFCEMQGRENSAESRMHLELARHIYPGKCGYSSETGGMTQNLRESTNNTKVRDFHKKFYRPENLKLVITGQIKHEDVFKVLAKLEEKIISKGPREPFERPWQSPVPPIVGDSKELIIKYPNDEENHGLYAMAWRGPSCVKDLYSVTAAILLLKYLTEYSVSPLPKEFVEIEDPYASKVSYNISENSETCIYLLFDDVPVGKLPEVGPKLRTVLKRILDEGDIDMERLRSIINRYTLENLSNLENSPHHTVAFMIIGHMLYGDTKADLEQRVNPLTDLAKLQKEPKDYWLGILRKYMIENKYMATQMVPSKEEQQKLAKEEKERVESRVKELGEEGLKKKGEILCNAIEFNERPPPPEMLISVPIPSVDSIKFHNIYRFSSDEKNERINLADTPVFTYFDHLKTNFVYMFALLDTSSVPSELRSYLPLMLDSLLELPLEREGNVIPYEEVVAQLNDDTVSSSTSIGVGSHGTFTCGSFSNTATVVLQVESSKYEKGLTWLKELLYKTVFTVERLKVIAMKMNNSVSQVKRWGRSVVAYVMRGLRYSEDSNVMKNGVLQQNRFLTEIIEKLDTEAGGKEILEKMETLRKIITDPENFVLYLAGNLDYLKEPVKAIKGILPDGVKAPQKQQRLHVTPDYELMKQDSPLDGCIIGMGCLESSFFFQTINSITDYTDPDLPALMLYLQYIIQAEGPMWKQIRGKGYSYSYRMSTKVHEGLLYLIYGKATNVVGAYKETKDIIQERLQSRQWDSTLLDSARSSIIFNIIDEEKTIGSVVSLSVISYFQGVDYQYNRRFLELTNKVTVEDLNRVGEKYIAPLFAANNVKTAVVADPAKIDEIASGFKKLDLDLKVYPSLEDSFLNKA
nr:unnamed protein product [Callosobruchus chinensis]